MRAGKLRHRIEIQKPVEVENPQGEPVKSWELVDTVWASIDPISANERFTALQVMGEVTHQIGMRYRQIDTAWRLKYGQRVFNIDSSLNYEERNVRLTILAREEV